MNLFRLPDLGEGLAEASIVAWHVQPGDEVQAGQLLVTVETAKAVVDIPAPQAGRIARLLAAPGETVPTHAPLLAFAAPDEAGADAGSVVGTLAQGGPLQAETFLIGRHRPAAATAQPRPAARPPLFEGGEPLDATRRSMAEALARAEREVVRVTLHAEAEIRFQDRRELTARLVRALVAGARAEPALNAWYDGARQVWRRHEAVHVGIAVDTPHGLFVPVLRDAQTLALGSIAREVAALKQAAHAHRLTPAQLAGATLTLSNFGALGGHFATPLVTPPQVAILGAGHAYDALAADGEAPRRVRRLPLSLSFDHRAVTGGEAARFLQAVLADLAAA